MQAMKLLLPIAACLSIQAASAQQMLGNLSASVDVKTEGLFVLTNPARTQGINVYVKVAYKGGAFENRLMPNGDYQLVPTKPPTIGPDSYLGYREQWIYKKDGSIDIAKSRQGMLVQRIVGIGATSMGTAYIVKGEGFDLVPTVGDRSGKHSILDNGKSAFSATEASVQDHKGKPLTVHRTTTSLPIAGVADAARQIYIVRGRDKQGLPIMLSASQFAGVEVHKVGSIANAAPSK